MIHLATIVQTSSYATGAWEQFDKAVKLKPEEADGYFYRGLAALQLKKNADAKADLQKYLQMDPTGGQAADAKELLKSIK